MAAPTGGLLDDDRGSQSSGPFGEGPSSSFASGAFLSAAPLSGTLTPTASAAAHRRGSSRRGSDYGGEGSSELNGTFNGDEPILFDMIRQESPQELVEPPDPSHFPIGCRVEWQLVPACRLSMPRGLAKVFPPASAGSTPVRPRSPAAEVIYFASRDPSMVNLLQGGAAALSVGAPRLHGFVVRHSGAHTLIRLQRDDVVASGGMQHQQASSVSSRQDVSSPPPPSAGAVTNPSTPMCHHQSPDDRSLRGGTTHMVGEAEGLESGSGDSSLSWTRHMSSRSEGGGAGGTAAAHVSRRSSAVVCVTVRRNFLSRCFPPTAAAAAAGDSAQHHFQTHHHHHHQQAAATLDIPMFSTEER